MEEKLERIYLGERSYEQEKNKFISVVHWKNRLNKFNSMLHYEYTREVKYKWENQLIDELLKKSFLVIINDENGLQLEILFEKKFLGLSVFNICLREKEQIILSSWMMYFSPWNFFGDK